MSLRLIPVENAADDSKDFTRKNHAKNPQNKKNFNPGNKLNKNQENDAGLKALCLRLVHFVNRGGRYTYEQVDDIIVGLHQSILKLQKKKQDILRNKGSKKKK